MSSSSAASDYSPKPLNLGTTSSASNPSNSSNAPPGAPRTPAAILSAWTSKLAQVGLRDVKAASRFFEHLAIDQLGDQHAQMATQVFNDLIEHEAYGLFLEIYTAYNKIQQAQAEARGAAFKSSLVLQLPAGWRPYAENEMVETFRQVQAEHVTLLRPGKKVAGQTGDLDQGILVDHFQAIPRVVSLCVETLLRADGGTTKLTVRGILEDLPRVRSAIASSRLVSFEVGDELSDSEATEWVRMLDARPEENHRLILEWEQSRKGEDEGYWELMSGMARCRTLQHLTLGRADLIDCHGVFRTFHAEEGPQLKSIQVLGEPVEFDADNYYRQSSLPPKKHPLVLFMKAIGKFESLSEVKVHASVRGVTEFDLAFIEPLRGHAQLSKLEVKGDATEMSFPDTVDALYCAADLSVSCPLLRSFAWDGGILGRHSWDPETQTAEWEDTERDSGKDGRPSLVTLLSSPDFKLEALTVNGARPSPRSMRALLLSLKTNTSLRYLDLRGNLMNLEAVAELPEILKDNSTLREIRLSHDASIYHVMTNDGQVYQLMARLDADQKTVRAIELEPTFLLGVDPDVLVPAKAILTAIGSSSNIANIFTAPQAVIDQNRLRVLRQDLPNLMRRAVDSSMTSSAAAGKASYGDVADSVLPHLSWRDVVHLSAVNRDGDSSRDPTTPDATGLSANVREFVRLTKGASAPGQERSPAEQPAIVARPPQSPDTPPQPKA